MISGTLKQALSASIVVAVNTCAVEADVNTHTTSQHCGVMKGCCKSDEITKERNQDGN